MVTLVLGANGLVGANVVEALTAAGEKVRAFDRFSRPPVFKESPPVEVFSGDFHSTISLRVALEQVNKVVIAVGASSPAASDSDPLLDLELSLSPTVRLLEHCAYAGVEHIYFCSSGGAIYGEIPAGQESSREEDYPHPVSPYGISKLAIEGYLDYFHRKYGIKTTTFRISNVYGRPVRFVKGQGLIPAVMLAMAKNQPITRMGDGSAVRDFIYAPDLAQMMVNVIQGDPQHHLYNLGSGVPRNIDSVIAGVSEVFAQNPEIQEIPNPKTFLSRQLLNISRYESEFGNVEATDFIESLRELKNSLS